MKEINYKDMKFNPFNLIGGEWMLVTAGNEQKCNTMTASWGHLGCLWGHNDPTAVIYLRPSRYTKEFVDEEKSLVCPIQLVPDNTVERDDGWKAFRIEGIFK